MIVFVDRVEPIVPTTDERQPKDERVKEWVSYAQGVERDMYTTAGCRVGSLLYLFLII